MPKPVSTLRVRGKEIESEVNREKVEAVTMKRVSPVCGVGSA